jgi:signal transduction histidine kinase
LLDASASALWTSDGDRLVVQAASYDHAFPDMLPVQGSLVGQAVVDRAPVVSDDLASDARLDPIERATSGAWTHALVVPLFSSDDYRPIGAFCVYSARGDTGRLVGSEWDEKVLTCLAHYAALALYNTGRQETLRAIQEQHAVAETFAAVGDIAANVLHHLNNKVGSIPVRIQGIRHKCQPALLADVYLSANLDKIEHSASEALEAVRENLAHLHPIHPVPVQAAPCVAAAIEAANLPVGLQVCVEDLDPLPAVVAGQRSLTFVFENLLGNAAEAMPEGGAVRIRGIADAEWVEIVVSDDGPGIPLELHERIFEFSLSNSASARPDRLGFGLWWVKTLMVRLGGSITVESDGTHGTTFRLKFPRAEGP